MKKKEIENPILGTWSSLNQYVMVTDDEKALAALLKVEQAGKARKQFILRIHSRINRLRAARERLEFKVVS